MVAESQLSVLHVARLRAGRIGGIYQSIPQLIKAQFKIGTKVGFLNTAGDDRLEMDEAVSVLNSSRAGAFSGLDRFSETFFTPSVINFHSCYVPEYAVLAVKALRNSIPYVITPRGAMTQGAQSYKGLKKILGNLLFQNWMIANASAIHCLTDSEARDAQTWGRPIFVVPNGTDLDVPLTRLLTCEDYKSEMRLLFLGRLDIYHKGLDVLLGGLAKFRSRHPFKRLRLKLVGPDERGSSTEIKRMIKTFDLEDIVELIGPKTGQEKEQFFHWAELFLHPSRFEGQPLAVLEALAHGLPVLLSPGTNLCPQVLEAGAGWCVQPTADGIASALSDIFSNRDWLSHMAEAARALAEREFDWTCIARQMIVHYKSISE